MEYTHKIEWLDRYIDDLINSDFAENPQEVKSFKMIQEGSAFFWPRHNVILELMCKINEQNNKIMELKYEIDEIRRDIK